MNNYDQSSSGVNLSLSCYYDLDLARIYFDEDLTLLSNNDFSLLNDRYRGVNIYQLNLGEETDQIDLVDFKNWNITKKSLLSAIKDYYDCLKEVSEDCKRHLGVPLSKCNKSDLIDFLEIDLYNRSEIIEFLVKYFSFKFEVVSSRGYCQGDYCEVVIASNDKKLIDRLKKSNYVDNLVWDQPIYCQLDINDNEFSFNDYIKNCYNYDKGEIISIADKYIEHDKKDYILSWLESNLPEQPEYL